MKIQNFVMKLQDRNERINDFSEERGEGQKQIRHADTSTASAPGRSTKGTVVGKKDQTKVGSAILPGKRGAAGVEIKGRPRAERTSERTGLSAQSPPPSPLAKAPVPHQNHLHLRSTPTPRAVSSNDGRVVSGKGQLSLMGFETYSGSDTDGENEGERPPNYGEYGEEVTDEKKDRISKQSTDSLIAYGAPPSRKSLPLSHVQQPGLVHSDSRGDARVVNGPTGAAPSICRGHSVSKSVSTKVSSQAPVDASQSRRDKLKQMREAAAARVQAKKKEDEEARR